MPYTSIREAAEEIHSGIITPTELVMETIERIDEPLHGWWGRLAVGLAR